MNSLRKGSLRVGIYTILVGSVVLFFQLEFCGCSLDASISRQDVLSGNEEHIARVRHAHSNALPLKSNIIA